MERVKGTVSTLFLCGYSLSSNSPTLEIIGFFKKNKYEKTFGIFLFCTTVILFCSCSQTEVATSSIQLDKTRVEDFSKLGELHNSMLQNIKDNFICNDSMLSLSNSEKIDYLLKYNTDYIDITDIDIQDKSAIKSNMSFYRNLLDASTFSPFKSSDLVSRASTDATDTLSASFSNDSILSIEDINNLIENLAYAHDNGMIPENAYSVISEIIDLLHKSNDGLITDALLEEKISEIIKKVNKMESEDGDSSIAYIAPVLVIAQYSLEWWKNNPDAMSDDDGKIAPFVYADAAGAIEGVVGYALTTKNVTWSGAGWSALAGGALCSIGFGGRVVQFLRRMIK